MTTADVRAASCPPFVHKSALIIDGWLALLMSLPIGLVSIIAVVSVITQQFTRDEWLPYGLLPLPVLLLLLLALPIVLFWAMRRFRVLSPGERVARLLARRVGEQPKRRWRVAMGLGAAALLLALAVIIWQVILAAQAVAHVSCGYEMARRVSAHVPMGYSILGWDSVERGLDKWSDAAKPVESDEPRSPLAYHHWAARADDGDHMILLHLFAFRHTESAAEAVARLAGADAEWVAGLGDEAIERRSGAMVRLAVRSDTVVLAGQSATLSREELRHVLAKLTPGIDEAREAVGPLFRLTSLGLRREVFSDASHPTTEEGS